MVDVANRPVVQIFAPLLAAFLMGFIRERVQQFALHIEQRHAVVV
jgi:hypothetical protein